MTSLNQSTSWLLTLPCRCLELHKTESDDLMRQKVLEIKSIQLKHEAESKVSRDT